MTQVEEKKRDLFKIFLMVLYVISLAIYGYFVFEGLQFYRTPYAERPYHPDYRAFRPAGFQGHGFGILGSAMMLFMLLYTVRKRTKLFGEWGSLSRWLDIHIYFGIMGPLFIILHTAFKVQGLVAVSFWSMIAVATSGIVGRYLYLQIPRNRMGEELNLRDIQEMNDHFSRELQEELKLPERQLLKMEEFSTAQININQNVLFLLIAMFFQDLMAPLQRFRLRWRFSRKFHLSGTHLQHAVLLTQRKIKLQRRILALEKVERLFHYWHVFHKPFAFIMYFIMVIHVGIAVWLGYTWVF